MRKNVTLGVFVLLLFTIVSINGFAQSTNNDSRLTGTWIDMDGTSTILFNSDGTGSMDGQRIQFGAIEGKMVLYVRNEQIVIDYIISNNGNTLILIAYHSQTGGRSGQVLQKRR